MRLPVPTSSYRTAVAVGRSRGANRGSELHEGLVEGAGLGGVDQVAGQLPDELHRRLCESAVSGGRSRRALGGRTLLGTGVYGAVASEHADYVAVNQRSGLFDLE